MDSIPSLAFLLDNAGLDEWAFLGAIVFLLFGPKRLPEIARTIGRTLGKIRRAADDFRGQIAQLDDSDPPPKLQSQLPSAAIRPEAEAPVNSEQLAVNRKGANPNSL